MKLWILRPIEGRTEWSPWYDKSFGFVVQAKDEITARESASEECGDEGPLAWLDSRVSTCKILEPGEVAEVIMKDFAAA